MAIIRLYKQRIAEAGITPTYTSPLTTTDTYTVENNGKLFLHFKKTEAGNALVTIQTPVLIGGLLVEEREVTVLANVGDLMVGPFPAGIYNNDAGDLRFTVSNITGLSVAVIELR